MDIASARETALATWPCEEYDHFGKVAFRLKAKKPGGKPGRTYMTLWLDEGYAVLMFDKALQTEWLEHRSGAFVPHPSKWGQSGATIMHLGKLTEKVFREAVGAAVVHAGRK